MPHIGFNPELEHRFQLNRRLGSDVLMVGWVLLGMCAVTGIFVFQDIREGTHLWLVWNTVFGILGLALVVIGTAIRRRIPHE